MHVFVLVGMRGMPVGIGTYMCMLVMLIGLRLEEFLGIFFEFRQAVMAAEIVGLPVVLVLPRSRARLDGHAADWIDHLTPLVKIITSSG